MSGHNKWTQIKRKKEVTDKKKSQIFSKLLKAISIAAKDDPNPNYNSVLKTAIERAKEFNVPQENIEKAIKKSSDSDNIKEILIEAYGPEGTALLIKAQTDNSNRTIAEIKKILNEHDGKWGNPGSVTWAFEKTTDNYSAKFPQKLQSNSEEKLLKLMEALDDHDDVVEIYSNADLENHE